MFHSLTQIGPRGRAVLVMIVGGALALPFLRSRSIESSKASSRRQENWADKLQPVQTRDSLASFDSLPSDFPIPARPAVPPTWMENQLPIIELAGRYGSRLKDTRDSDKKSMLLPMQPLRPWMDGPVVAANQEADETAPPAARIHSPSIYSSPWDRLPDTANELNRETTIVAGPAEAISREVTTPNVKSKPSEQVWPDEKSAVADFTSLFAPKFDPEQQTASVTENTARLSPPVHEASGRNSRNSFENAAPLLPPPKSGTGRPSLHQSLPPQITKEKHYIYQPQKKNRNLSAK